MKIALQVLAYDVDRYINSMLRNAAPWVDKIYIAYPERPWNYVPASRSSRRNPTQLSSIDTAGLPCEIEILEGDWLKEEDTRNDCLNRARSEGFQWMLIQDADEFYEESAWRHLKTYLASTDVSAFRTTWYNFWKSSHYIIIYRDGSIKSTNAAFALRCDRDLGFCDKRRVSRKDLFTVDEPCHHYGWVKSDQEVMDKVTQWGHAGQFDAKAWFHLKWCQWNTATRYLQPMTPRDWNRAIRFPLPQPPFHSEFALPVGEARPSLSTLIRDHLYNIRANSVSAAKDIKRLVLR